MPGFTGESSLYKTDRGYFTGFWSGTYQARVTLQQRCGDIQAQLFPVVSLSLFAKKLKDFA
jgi:hypothetical protein